MVRSLLRSRISDTVFSYQIAAPAPNAPQGNILMSVDLNKGKSDVESINASIEDYTTNVQNTFFNSDYAYIATTGIPNYKVGPFIGSALLPGNQRKLSRFQRLRPFLVVRTLSLVLSVLGLTVLLLGLISHTQLSLVVLPVSILLMLVLVMMLQINHSLKSQVVKGLGAAADVTVNGSLFSVDVTNGGTGYTTQPLVSIVGGGGFGATATAVITNGVVSKILVETPGEGYTSSPTVSISGGNGTGATATAEVRGPIQSIAITGIWFYYTSSPDIKPKL